MKAACIAFISFGVIANAGSAFSFSVTIQSAVSPTAAHPVATAPIDSNTKLLGGGAWAVSPGAGNFVYKTAPSTNYAAWVGQGKDQWISDPGLIAAYAVQFNDPDNLYDVSHATASSGISSNPSARATVPAGYVMTGGGCFVDWESAPQPSGNLLSSSYPDTQSSWTCDGHADGGNAAAITAYVIGIRPLSSSTPMPVMTIQKAVGAVDGAAVQVTPTGLSNDTFVTGGGAKAELVTFASTSASGSGRIRARPVNIAGWVALTASNPVYSTEAASAWAARAVSRAVEPIHTVLNIHPAPAFQVTAYAVVVQFPTRTLTGLTPPAGPPGTVVTLTGTYFANGMTVQLSQGATTLSVQPTIVSATQAEITVPTSLTVGPLNVSASSGNGFTAPMPFGVTCACMATGGFSAPQQNSISASGPTGSFTNSFGTFELTATPSGATATLDIVFDKTATIKPHVFDTSGAVAWGLSPDNLYFVVVSKLTSTNAGAPIAVYRVSTSQFGASVLSDVAWPDGFWGFNSNSTQFVISRGTNNPLTGATHFGFTAYDLLASNPRTAKVSVDELHPNLSITLSPCGDLLMYFRWVQLSPASGQSNFYSRGIYPMNQSVVATTSCSGNSMSCPAPSAATATKAGPLDFVVNLTGAKTSSGQTSFSTDAFTNQCTAK